MHTGNHQGKITVTAAERLPFIDLGFGSFTTKGRVLRLPRYPAWRFDCLNGPSQQNLRKTGGGSARLAAATIASDELAHYVYAQYAAVTPICPLP